MTWSGIWCMRDKTDDIQRRWKTKTVLPKGFFCPEFPSWWGLVKQQGSDRWRGGRWGRRKRFEGTMRDIKRQLCVLGLTDPPPPHCLLLTLHAYNGRQMGPHTFDQEMLLANSHNEWVVEPGEGVGWEIAFAFLIDLIPLTFSPLTARLP